MKILMVGLGAIGQRHVRNLRTLLNMNVDLLAYRVHNSAQVLTDQLQIEDGSDLAAKYAISVYREYEEALNQRPDVVFVCNPTSLHMPIALQAAQAGCHLFIEKPLSHDMAGVANLIQLVEDKKLRAVVGHQMRFHPCLARLKSLVQGQSIGRILSVRAEVGEYLPAWHGYEDYRQMYASRKDLGGGALLTQIHELDYIYWLFGVPSTVYAVGGHLSSLDIDVEDTVDILFEYQIGGHSIPVSVHLDYVQRPPRRICEVIGDSGKIMIDLRALTVNVWDSQGHLIEAVTYEGFQRNQLFLDELNAFLEYLRGNQVALPTVPEALQSLRMALAAKESLRSGAVLSLASEPNER